MGKKKKQIKYYTECVLHKANTYIHFTHLLLNDIEWLMLRPKNPYTSSLHFTKIYQFSEFDQLQVNNLIETRSGAPDRSKVDLFRFSVGFIGFVCKSHIECNSKNAFNFINLMESDHIFLFSSECTDDTKKSIRLVKNRNPQLVQRIFFSHES